MESATILCPNLIATTPQMSLLSLCALLFQQSHLFLNGEVLTYKDSWQNIHELLPNSKKVCVNDFWFPRWLHELHQVGLLGSFCFTWVGL